MNKMGLEVVSFTIKEVRDKNDYIVNMGRPDVARIKRDADVAAAEAERDTAIKRAEATRESAIAKAQADQERVLAETLSQAKQAEAQRDLEIKKAQLPRDGQEAAGAGRQGVRDPDQRHAAAGRRRGGDACSRSRSEQQIKVQEAEILRREKELIATVLKQAEVERQRIEMLAEAEKSRLIDRGRRPRRRRSRAQGEAEAEIIFKKGDAEARAMNVKAEAYQEYNQAAVIDKLLTQHAGDGARAGRAAGKVDKITIVSTGNGGSTGMHKITGDMTEMAAQVPALFEALSGMPMADLLSKVRKIGDKAPQAGRRRPSRG